MSTKISRWHWALLLVGFCSWLSLGCSPQSLSMLLRPFGGDRVDPEFKLFTSNNEISLVILTNFAQPDLRDEIAPVETELADKLSRYIQGRCQENKHKIKIVPQAQVSSHVLKQLAEGEFSPVEIGKHFKADYVLDLNIKSFEIYEKKSRQGLYNGKTEIQVDLYKMNVKEGDPKVFKHEHHGSYPRDGAIESSSMTATQFRGIFQNILARDISKLFIAYPQQERMQID